MELSFLLLLQVTALIVTMTTTILNYLLRKRPEDKWSTERGPARVIRPEEQPLMDPEVNSLLQPLHPEVSS